MKSLYFHIAALISKFLQMKETDVERDEMQLWLNENDPENEILESFMHTHANEDIDYIMGLDRKEAYKRFNEVKRAYKRRIIIGQLFRAAIWLAVFPIGYFLMNQWNENRSFTVEKKILQQNELMLDDVGPGSSKAFLKLSDGQVIDLESRSMDMSESDGTSISNNLFGTLTYSSSSVAPKELIYNTVVVPRSGHYQLNLSDGTKVWINALSELSFPVSFVSDERLVKLKGEAYFEVAHDAEKPFVVEVDGLKTKVLGTSFNINNYAGPVVTTLIDGEVEIQSKKGDKLNLKPGYAAIAASEITVEKANIEKVIAWKNGDFYFKSDPIEEIMEEIARWYDIQVDYIGKLPKDSKMSGKIARNSNLSIVLESVSYACGARFEIVDNRVRVFSE